MGKEFTSKKGLKLALRPVSQFKLDTMRASKKEIPAPMYTMTTVTGTQQVPLDEEIATNQGRLEEWNEYKALHQKVEAEFGKKFFALLVWDGTDFEIPPSWEEECAFFGIELPENPIARKVQYVYDQVLSGPEEMGDLMADIMLVSQLSQEVVDNLRASFRSRMAGQANKRMSPTKVPLESAWSSVRDAGNGAPLEPVAK